MKSCFFLLLALALSVVTASAGTLPSRLIAFEDAFRTAHDAKDMSRFDRLVCWDRTTSETRRFVREEWRRDFRWPITSMHILWDEAEGQDDPNIPAQHTLLVWYAQFGAPSRYFITSRHGGYRLTIQRGEYGHRHYPIALAHSDLTRRFS